MEAEKKQSAVPIFYNSRNDNNERITKKDMVIIEVKDNLNKLLDSVVADECGSSSRKSIEPSIYKIPKFMKGTDEGKAFEPWLVSFGPYHHGKQHLVPMEQQKLKAFWRFIYEYGVKFESIVEIVSKNLEYLLGAYDQLDEKWKKQDAAKFFELMILDACFMLDFFKDCPSSLSTLSTDITRDILLLENQLPFKLLRELYAILVNKADDIQSLRSLICKSMLIENVEAVTGNELHILDMYRASLLYPPIDRKDYSVKTKEYDYAAIESQIIPQATKLCDAGIKFKKSPTKSLTDVSFDSKQGVLNLPDLVVDDDSETILLNVMAFEKLHVKAGSQVTSFVTFLTNLIQEDKDVSLMASNGILVNWIRNRKVVVELFNLLAKGPATDLDDVICEVIWKVNKHRKNPWTMWWANLKNPETQNPWVIISIAAASFGFLLQIIQTIYGVYGIYYPNH